MRRVNVQLSIEADREDIDILISAPELDGQLEALVAQIECLAAGRLTVYDEHDTAIPLSPSSIVSISTDKRRLKIVADEGTYCLRRTSLREVEELLQPSMFQRISRYEIVNLRKVRRFDFSLSGALRVEMEGGYETWASRRLIPTIKERLQRGW